jgi:hypothetical protein
MGNSYGKREVEQMAFLHNRWRRTFAGATFVTPEPQRAATSYLKMADKWEEGPVHRLDAKELSKRELHWSDGKLKLDMQGMS